MSKLTLRGYLRAGHVLGTCWAPGSVESKGAWLGQSCAVGGRRAAMSQQKNTHCPMCSWVRQARAKALRSDPRSQVGLRTQASQRSFQGPAPCSCHLPAPWACWLLLGPGENARQVGSGWKVGHSPIMSEHHLLLLAYTFLCFHPPPWPVWFLSAVK